MQLWKCFLIFVITKQKDMKNLNNETVETLLALAIAKFFGDGQLSTYAEICGSYEDGAQQWLTHNVRDIEVCENQKYIGWKVFFNNSDKEERFVLPQNIAHYIETKCKKWKHIKCTFLKYARPTT